MLQEAFAKILDVGVDRWCEMVADRRRNHDLVGTGKLRKTRREIYTMAVDVISADQNLALFDTWDESSFFEHVDQECSPQVAAAMRRIYEWAHSSHSHCWGKGQIVPSFYIGSRKPSASILSLQAGTVSVLFANIKKIPPFDHAEVQRDFIQRLNYIPGVDIDEDSFERTYRDIRLHSLYLPEGAEQLLEVLSWMGEQIKGANGERPLT